MSKTYIHYGHKAFEPSSFTTPTNHSYANKPNGGLWASATDAPYGWKDWCKAEDFRQCDDDNAFTFMLSDNANIFEINCIADVGRMPRQHKTDGDIRFIDIDFERMYENGVDAIVLNLSNDPDLYFLLYGWDCDCILVLNPEVIISHNTTK